MQHSIGLRSLAVAVPDRVITNDFWHQSYPDVVAAAEERIWMWKKPQDKSEGSEPFNLEMQPYVTDPFRGARKRRFMEPGGTALELESDAARQALAAAGVTADEIDLLICTSFLPDSVGIGGAAFLARELGLEGAAAWNLETACSSTNVAFQTACGLVQSGQHRHALVVTSCCYSRVTVPSDPVCWGIGDAATAIVVGPVRSGAGLLGSHTVHSGATCGAITYEMELDEASVPYIRLRPQSTAARLLRETSEGYLRECVGSALDKAGLGLGDVDHFIFNTPLAWYASFCARALGVERSKSISVYPIYANVGPALLGLNLFHAAHWKGFRPDDVVVLYSVGSVSSCSAAVVRWGDARLGALPANFDVDELAALEEEAIAGPVAPPIAAVA